MRTSEKNAEATLEALHKSETAAAVDSGSDTEGRPVPVPQKTLEGGAVPQEEYDRLKADRDQIFDRLARLQAEFENARKREARERTDFQETAMARAIENFLPVLDNFQLARGSSGSVEQVRSGVELIVKQMEDVLRSLQVQPVETVGSKFNPRIHEAIESVERDDLPDKQVLEEVRRGYRIRDRLLRPALVRVVNNSQKES